MDSSFLKHSRATFRDSRDSRETRAAPYCSINFYPWPCNKSDQVFFFISAKRSSIWLVSLTISFYWTITNSGDSLKMPRNSVSCFLPHIFLFSARVGNAWPTMTFDDFLFVCLFVCLFVFCFMLFGFEDVSTGTFSDRFRRFRRRFCASFATPARIPISVR